MVEWKKLGEVCTFHRGKTITAKDAVDGDIPVIAGGQTPSYYHNESNREGESITVAGSGAYAGFVSYWNQPIFVSDAFTIDPLKGLKHKYLFHWAKMNQGRIIATQKGAGVPHVHGKDIANFLIPIPSLSEQSRIVSILDTFTSSISNLKQQIEERRKQYEYERNLLLDLEGKEGVEMKKLGEVCEIKGRIGFRGYTKEDQVAKGEGALTLTATNIVNQRIDFSNNTYITWEKYNESPEIMVNNGDIIICQRGSIGKIAIVENLRGEATINPQLLLLKNFSCNNKYLNYYLRSKWFQDKLKTIIGYGTIQMIAQKDLKNLSAPFINEEAQSRIVSILDTFEQSISNLEEQLAMREKQYEYYRNQLLTFEGEEERGKT